jgi:hypothetical protein
VCLVQQQLALHRDVKLHNVLHLQLFYVQWSQIQIKYLAVMWVLYMQLAQAHLQRLFVRQQALLNHMHRRLIAK